MVRNVFDEVLIVTFKRLYLKIKVMYTLLWEKTNLISSTVALSSTNAVQLNLS